MLYAAYKLTVTLTEDSTIRLRAITANYVERLLVFYRLSRHSVYLRFHHVLPHLSRKEAERFCAIDSENSFALVATTTNKQNSSEKIVASGGTTGCTEEAEVAFIVKDKYQKKGIGTHLLQQLAAIAKEYGFRRFRAEVLAENHKPR